MQDVQASGKVVERGVVVDHRLALPIDQAHTGFGLDAANARDRCAAGLRCSGHRSARSRRCGEKQLIVVATGQGALV